MRLEEALAKHGIASSEDLPDYERGWLEGVQAYAWMKDGSTFVGTTGRTLGDAVDRFLSDRRTG